MNKKTFNKSVALTLSHVPVTVVMNKYLPNSYSATESLLQTFTHTILSRMSNGIETTPKDVEEFLNEYFMWLDGVRKSLLIIELNQILIDYVKAIGDFSEDNMNSKGYGWSVSKYVTTWEVMSE